VAAGESAEVKVQFPVSDLAYYDVDTSAWVVEALEYTVYAGPSATDLPLSQPLNVR